MILHRISVVLVSGLLLAGCTARREAAPVPQPSAPASFTALEAQLRARIAREAPGEISIDLIDLATGRQLGIDSDKVMHAASTMKVPVLLELYRQAGAGRFSLDDSIVVKNAFTSIGDGRPFSADPAEDSEQPLYGMVGRKATIRDLVLRMITRSSDLATNNLIELVTPDSIQRTMRAIRADGVNVLRGVQDNAAFRKGMNNTTTAAGFARLLESIARCDVASPAACGEMIDILARQEFNEMIPAGLPKGTRVAHKTGWITGIQHDGAIVYPPGRPPYVLVVLMRGITDTLVAQRAAADISRMVWENLTMPSAAGDAAGTSRRPGAELVEPLLDLQRRYAVNALANRRFTHGELWRALEPLFAAGSPLVREEIGRSVEDRPIQMVQYGHGATRVLLWSQMHGDESTATMALADLLNFLANARNEARATAWADKLTILVVPMLNPDGAERFQRRNALGIDVNRDARRLASPEGRALRELHKRFQPQFGFNLHDQNVRTQVGGGPELTAIALLAPAPDNTGLETAARARAKRLASFIRRTIEPLVGGHIAKYDDAFNPRAFGDLMQSWGTSTVLIESGGWEHDPEKQYLRKVNFAAIAGALDAIANGTYSSSDVRSYDELPTNGTPVLDLIIRRGTVVIQGMPPFKADIAVDFEDALDWKRGGHVVDIGDLEDMRARESIDATDLFVHPDGAMLRTGPDGRATLAVAMPARLTIRRTADASSAVVTSVGQP